MFYVVVWSLFQLMINQLISMAPVPQTVTNLSTNKMQLNYKFMKRNETQTVSITCRCCE